MAWSDAARAAAAEVRRLHKSSRMDLGRQLGVGTAARRRQKSLASKVAKKGISSRAELAKKIRAMRAGQARFRDIGVMQQAVASTTLRNAARRK